MDMLLLQSISLAVAEAREVAAVLNMIVRGLAETAGLALARIWLMQSAAGVEPPLHSDPELVLAASVGSSGSTGGQWTGLARPFRRFPWAAPKIGLIGATGESI